MWAYIIPIVTAVIGYFVGRRGFLASVKDVKNAAAAVQAEVQK